MKGYWNQPEATAEIIRDGWLHTGDIGYVDADEAFFITDRRKDIIIKSGENISPLCPKYWSAKFSKKTAQM